MGMHVVIVGNPEDGVVYGPFKTKDDAIQWARNEKVNGRIDAWWAVPLRAQSEGAKP